MIDSRTILGIDPGTNVLGFGVIRIDEKKHPQLVDAGVLDLRKDTDPYLKLEKIHQFVSRLCADYSPDDLAIESPFMDKNAQVIFKLGRAQGAAIIAASQFGVLITEYAPRKAKIAICGNGAASKEQGNLRVEKILGTKIENQRLDATDALAIALCHFYQLTSPLSSVSASSSWKKFLEANPDRIK